VHNFPSKHYITASDNQQGRARIEVERGLSLARDGPCGVAVAFQFNRIFDHSFRYSLLLLAVSTDYRDDRLG
jgi:hypothetical protein